MFRKEIFPFVTEVRIYSTVASRKYGLLAWTEGGENMRDVLALLVPRISHNHRGATNDQNIRLDTECTWLTR
jgi:hypothetical protein